MLIELYIFFQIIVIGFFLTSFFTKQEILWFITLVFSGMLMVSAFNVQYYVYIYNTTIASYMPIAKSSSYPWLMGINLMFMALSLTLGMFDIFDKYGNKIASKVRDPDIPSDTAGAPIMPQDTAGKPKIPKY